VSIRSDVAVCITLGADITPVKFFGDAVKSYLKPGWLLFILLILCGVGLALVYVVNFERKTEFRSGTLQIFRGHCILLTDDVSLESLARQSDFTCSGRSDAKCAVLHRTDGLESSFCERHKDLIGSTVRIEGVRVGSKDIDQDCANRSCFSSVSLAD
jgi:hypothetical protein